MASLNTDHLIIHAVAERFYRHNILKSRKTRGRDYVKTAFVYKGVRGPTLIIYSMVRIATGFTYRVVSPSVQKAILHHLIPIAHLR